MSQSSLDGAPSSLPVLDRQAISWRGIAHNNTDVELSGMIYEPRFGNLIIYALDETSSLMHLRRLANAASARARAERCVTLTRGIIVRSLAPLGDDDASVIALESEGSADERGSVSCVVYRGAAMLREAVDLDLPGGMNHADHYTLLHLDAARFGVGIERAGNRALTFNIVCSRLFVCQHCVALDYPMPQRATYGLPTVNFLACRPAPGQSSEVVLTVMYERREGGKEHQRLFTTRVDCSHENNQVNRDVLLPLHPVASLPTPISVDSARLNLSNNLTAALMCTVFDANFGEYKIGAFLSRASSRMEGAGSNSGSNDSAGVTSGSAILCEWEPPLRQRSKEKRLPLLCWIGPTLLVSATARHVTRLQVLTWSRVRASRGELTLPGDDNNGNNLRAAARVLCWLRWRAGQAQTRTSGGGSGVATSGSGSEWFGTRWIRALFAYGRSASDPLPERESSTNSSTAASAQSDGVGSLQGCWRVLPSEVFEYFVGHLWDALLEDRAG